MKLEKLKKKLLDTLGLAPHHVVDVAIDYGALFEDGFVAVRTNIWVEITSKLVKNLKRLLGENIMIFIHPDREGVMFIEIDNCDF